MPRTGVTAPVKVADEVWIATALLHREHPDRIDFSVTEIMERARREGVSDELRPGVRVHVLQHCVANRPPNPGRYRMLYATGRLTRRLYRAGDQCHPDREGGKVAPSQADVPAAYRTLIDWYLAEYVGTSSNEADPLLELRGSGKRLWAHEHADEYVARLRNGWT
jgi:hypothetical protein